MITRDEVDEAIRFIGTTDKRYVDAKTEVERAAWLCKHARALVYEMVDGKSVEDRKQAVERSQQVASAEDRRINAIAAFEQVKAERELRQLKIEVWRSLEATRRKETIQ